MHAVVHTRPTVQGRRGHEAAMAVVVKAIEAAEAVEDCKFLKAWRGTIRRMQSRRRCVR